MAGDEVVGRQGHRQVSHGPEAEACRCGRGQGGGGVSGAGSRRLRRREEGRMVRRGAAAEFGHLGAAEHAVGAVAAEGAVVRVQGVAVVARVVVGRGGAVLVGRAAVLFRAARRVGGLGFVTGFPGKH